MSKKNKGAEWEGVVTLTASGAPSDVKLLAAADIVAAAAAAEGEAPKRPTFKVHAYSGGLLRIWGFSRPIVIDLSRLRAGDVAMLLDHIGSQIVGQGKADIQSTHVDLDGIITGDIDDKEDPAGKVVMHAGNGFKWKASVGVSIDTMDDVEAGAKVTVNEREFTGPIYVVSGRLGETSFVSVGADETAFAKIAAHAAHSWTGGIQVDEFRKWVEAMGLSFDTLDDKAKAGLKAKFDAEVVARAKALSDPGSPVTPDSLDAQIKSAELEAKRCEAIGMMVLEAVNVQGTSSVTIETLKSLKQRAIEGKWSVADTKLELLKASRPNVGAAIHIHDAPAVTPSVLEAAVLMTARVSGDELVKSRDYSDQTVQAAHTMFRERIGLRQLFFLAAQANGFQVSPFSREVNQQVIEAAFGYGLQAGYSTLQIAGILSNVANKRSMAGFNSVENVWRQVAAIGTVTDLKTSTSYRLTGKRQFEKVKPTGAIKYGDFGEEAFTNKADAYALALGIPQEALINDDLGVLTKSPFELGQGWGLAINDTFWTEFLDNAAFFTAANGNYVNAAGTALSVGGFTLTKTAFRQMKTADKKPTGLQPKVLLVPSCLGPTALALIKSMEIRDNASGATYGTANPHQNAVPTILDSAYLDNESYPGYSATAYYVLADPETCPVIEVVFYNGQESPVIESVTMAPDHLGVTLRGYGYFGCRKQDTKGGVKSAGTAAS